VKRPLVGLLLSAACVEGLDCEEKHIPRPPNAPDGAASQAADVQPPGHRRFEDFGFGLGSAGAGGGDGGASQDAD
jgi:hypothetical protein